MTEQKKTNENMSGNFAKREAEIAAEKASKPMVQETVYFVSKASKARIGNFRHEVRSQTDRVIAKEKSIEFEENIRPVNKFNLKTRGLSAEYVFLAGDDSTEACDALKNGDIFEFDNKKDAMLKIRAMEAVKLGRKNIEIEDVQVDKIEFGANALKVNKVATSASR